MKPQFEAGRAAVSRNGLVRDEAAREAAVARIEAFVGERGWRLLGRIPSPIAGGDGNREFLVGAVRG